MPSSRSHCMFYLSHCMLYLRERELGISHCMFYLSHCMLYLSHRWLYGEYPVDTLK